jgi:hypothetical protein
MKENDAFFAEICEVLRRHQPALTACVSSGKIKISGDFVCNGPSGPFDIYQVEIEVSRKFPIVEPEVQEVSGRIPRTVERHIYPLSGNCCLGHWVVWLLKTSEPTFENFVAHHLSSYFIGQTIFELTGEWPFGEEGHNAAAIGASYREALNLPGSADEKAYSRLIGAPILRGNPYCPCGSGKRLRACHWNEIRDLRRRFPASVRKRIAAKIRSAKSE